MDEAIGELGHILNTHLNGRELYKKDTFCFGSFNIKKKSIGDEESKTKGVQKSGSKSLHWSKRSGICIQANGRSFLLSRKVGSMLFEDI